MRQSARIAIKAKNRKDDENDCESNVPIKKEKKTSRMKEEDVVVPLAKKAKTESKKKAKKETTAPIRVVDDSLIEKSQAKSGGFKVSSVSASLFLSKLVDQHAPVSGGSSVVAGECADDLPYHAMLNQTNLGNNNNKYFLIQVLQISGAYATWFRWGRVGYLGQNDFRKFTSLDDAIAHFSKKFSDKTGNSWPEVARSGGSDFETRAGKYTLIDAANTEAAAVLMLEEDNTLSAIVEQQKSSSSLPLDVLQFMELISNKHMFETELRNAFKFDCGRMPLGKLSERTIHEGYLVLREIEDALVQKASRSVLGNLSSRFYTLIPHDFGFCKMHNFIIDSLETVKDKAALLESLGEVEAAERLVVKGGDGLDGVYKRLGVSLNSVEKEGNEWNLVEEYRKGTIGKTHNTYKTNLVRVLRVGKSSDLLVDAIKESTKGKKGKKGKKAGAADGAADGAAVGAADGSGAGGGRFAERTVSNRTLLWHGSRLTNWVSILKQGLRIAPPEAPVTGYMFGKGVYFADCFTKSANYCFVNGKGRGVLALCEVELGEPLTFLHADGDAPKKLGTQYGSTFAEGQHRPAGIKHVDGLRVPHGPMVAADSPKPGMSRSLLYNEFIVYDTSKVNIKYVLEVEFSPLTDDLF